MTVRPKSLHHRTDEPSSWICDQRDQTVPCDHDCRVNCPANHGEQCCGFPKLCQEAIA